LSSDQDSIDQFLYLVKHWISDTLSSIVIEKSSGKCIGIIVCRFCSIEDNSLEFSRLRVIRQIYFTFIIPTNSIQCYNNNNNNNNNKVIMSKVSIYFLQKFQRSEIFVQYYFNLFINIKK